VAHKNLTQHILDVTIPSAKFVHPLINLKHEKLPSVFSAAARLLFTLQILTGKSPATTKQKLKKKIFTPRALSFSTEGLAFFLH